MSILNFIVYMLMLMTALNIGTAQSDCPRPSRRPNSKATMHPKQRSALLLEETTIIFKCNKGFQHAAGDDVIMCINGKWEGEPGKPYKHFKCTEKTCRIEGIENGKMEIDSSRNVTYSCNRGFKIKGFRQAQCRMNDVTGDYFLTSPLPSCIPLSTCEPPDVPNLLVNISDCCFAGEEAPFFCEEGFKLEGDSSAVCLPTGNWTQPFPHCRKIQYCADPGQPRHGSRFGDCCEAGIQLKYTCDEGYELVDQRDSVTCLHNEEWSGPIPKCKPAGETICENIPVEKNNLTVMSGLPSDRDVFMPYDEVDIDCIPGYYTEAEQTYLMCSEDGEWDSPVPECKPKGPCSRPPAPSHGTIIQLDDNPEQKQFPLLYEISLECDDGYASKNGRYGSQCLGNNVWSSRVLNCTRITCSNPGTPKHGSRAGDDFHYNSTVTFECMGSYTLIGSATRVCQENGRWSGHTAVCDAGDTDCPDPGEPVNSHRKGDDFNIGDVVDYSCFRGTVLIGNGTRYCMEGEDGGYWSGEEIECRAQNEFTDKDEAMDTLSDTVATVARKAPSSSNTMQIARSVVPPTGTDVFFAFDGSGSITDIEFGKAKDFADTLIRQVGISHEFGGVRVAITVFSKEAEEVIGLRAKTVTEVTKALRKMNRKKEGTNIAKALDKLAEFAQRSIKFNKNRKKIAFILTDGLWNTGGDPTEPAIKLRSQYLYNVEIYVIGIGNKRNDEALYKISGPHKNRVLLFKNHIDLVNTAAKAISRDIDYSACGLERPLSSDSDGTKGNRGKSPSRKTRSIDSIGTRRNRASSSALLARIVGGKDVKRPWPWMAALLKNTDRGFATQCGGSIIHQEWILTAAHCFKMDEKQVPDPGEWQVTIGATDLSKDSGWDYKVSSIELHKEYSVETLDYDIALVKLKNPAKYDLYIRPICLPPLFDDLPPNTNLYDKDSIATVIGYGHTKVMKYDDTDKTTVDHLRELDVRLQSEEVCQSTVEYGVVKKKPTPRMMCAGSGLGKEDACSGDSGGPLMQLANSASKNDTQERWFLVGINSWGVGCGLKGYYGYYSYVSKLRHWINNVTQVEFENVVPEPKPVIATG